MYQTDLANLFTLDDTVSRSICPENPTGEPGMGGRATIPQDQLATHPARDLGTGWKIRPYITLKAGTTSVLADYGASGGIIRHIWMVNGSERSRELILRMYWDGATQPAVECPVGDFFFNAWDKYSPVDSAAVAVNPAKGYNCFWSMPFSKGFVITIENRGLEDMQLYYQIDFHVCTPPQNMGYFHALFNRTNPLPYKQDYVILDTIQGKGRYVGTFVAYGANNNNWWGEGELKFFMDGDDQYPTICTTGTEDYFLGAYNFENWQTHQYQNYSTLFSGFYRMPTDTLYNCQTRFGMYRLHVQDAVCFHKSLRITMQSIGWRSGWRFHPQQDDIASVAIFYLDSPTHGNHILPSAEQCEII